MANQELMRIVDGIARDKNIEREQVYVDIEQAVASGLRKQFNTEDTSEFAVQVDRTNGDISVTRGGETLPLSVMGRIGVSGNGRSVPSGSTSTTVPSGRILAIVVVLLMSFCPPG